MAKSSSGSSWAWSGRGGVVAVVAWCAVVVVVVMAVQGGEAHEYLSGHGGGGGKKMVMKNWKQRKMMMMMVNSNSNNNQVDRNVPGGPNPCYHCQLPHDHDHTTPTRHEDDGHESAVGGGGRSRGVSSTADDDHPLSSFKRP
ncbi:uncharacterized protein LOC127249002 [Andrographis paniculata]|uniref:uncharacterized protein LOC127249002 n=1 Tax=Andrographis paniculata TaxID=175694 RepID=UPI0021E815E2|nr:uncharacterized protein LOC127249002 [Andrographis paniculata]XP_051127548.1 uncharacterized protein LOC127249002 [Andrographis paniculata]XP_051127549.1 uncharacterized protein LOC127249002 [Andrographis paniculata]XP_051127550.1 uncharacterized protein LOC127249002 [Andrographis paniculata]